MRCVVVMVGFLYLRCSFFFHRCAGVASGEAAMVAAVTATRDFLKARGFAWVVPA